MSAGGCRANGYVLVLGKELQPTEVERAKYEFNGGRGTSAGFSQQRRMKYQAVPTTEPNTIEVSTPSNTPRVRNANPVAPV